MLCCCKRRGPSTQSGPKGSASYEEEKSVPIIFQTAQPIIEPVTFEEIQKRNSSFQNYLSNETGENLLAAQLFLRGTVFTLEHREYFALGASDLFRFIA